MKIGISTGLFYHKDIITALDRISKAGFKYVEVWAGAGEWGKRTHFDYNDSDSIVELKKESRLRGLEIVSFNAPFSEQLDISSLDEMQRLIAVSEIKKSIVICDNFGAEHIVVHPAVKSFQVTDKEFINAKLKQIRKSLTEIVDHALLHDVKIACENPSPHLLGGWASDLMAIIDKFPETVLGVCLDTGHANLIEAPDKYLKEISSRLMSLHISDNDGSYSAHLIPGAGSIDWDKFIASLKLTGFNGTFMMEILGAARFEDPAEVLNKAYASATNLVKEL